MTTRRAFLTALGIAPVAAAVPLVKHPGWAMLRAWTHGNWGNTYLGLKAYDPYGPGETAVVEPTIYSDDTDGEIWYYKDEDRIIKRFGYDTDPEYIAENWIKQGDEWVRSSESVADFEKAAEDFRLANIARRARAGINEGDPYDIKRAKFLRFRRRERAKLRLDNIKSRRERKAVEQRDAVRRTLYSPARVRAARIWVNQTATTFPERAGNPEGAPLYRIQREPIPGRPIGELIE